MKDILAKLLKIPLPAQILLTLVAGGLYGYFLPNESAYVTWAGDIFLRALRMIVAPLILCSIISGVAGLRASGDGSPMARMGIKTLLYYTVTSLLSILVGLTLVNLVRPGDGFKSSALHATSIDVKPLSDTLKEIIPRNVFQALMQDDMLSIIFFAFLAGAILLRMKSEQSKTLTDFFQSGFELMMKMTEWIIRFAPLGVFGIVVAVVSEQVREGSLMESVASLGSYMAVVLLGLAIHAFITLFGILRVYGGFNPLRHLKAMSSALLMAFSTSSSSATLPLTMDCCEKNGGISNRTTSFVLPLGATVNMDGTALYECVATIFIAQASGIELTIGQQLIVVFTALLASVGAAGIPMAGLVTISIILNAVGLPPEGVAIILTVDRFLVIFRTSLNVWSVSCGAAVISRS